MKLAFLYAGQGSQRPGMGQDLYDSYDTFREIYDQAAADLSWQQRLDPAAEAFSVRDLCLQGSAEELGQTRYTQPCMVAFAVGVTKLLYEAGIRPELAAGLSLGEYAALYAAGAFDEETVVRLAAYRGLAMELAAPGSEYGMAAVLGLERSVLEECVAEASRRAFVAIANYNCPMQMVISGTREGVQAAGELAKTRGALKVVPLTVSGPFHTARMEPAGRALREIFRETPPKKLDLPVVFNATARPKQESETVEELLVRQVQSSVYFEDTIRYLLEAGVDTIVEIGPGKVLSGFVKKINRKVRICAVEDAASLEAAIRMGKGQE